MTAQPAKKRAHAGAAATSSTRLGTAAAAAAASVAAIERHFEHERARERAASYFEISVPFKPFWELLQAAAAHGDGSVLLCVNLVTGQLEAGSIGLSSAAIVTFDANRPHRSSAARPEMGDTLVGEVASFKNVVPLLAGICARRRMKTTPFLRLVFEQEEPLQLEIESDSGVSSSSYSAGNCKLLHWDKDRPWGTFNAKDCDHVAIADNIPLAALSADLRAMRQCATACRLQILAGDEMMPTGSIQLSVGELDFLNFGARVRISRAADSSKAISVRPGYASTKEFTGFLQKLITAVPSQYEFANANPGTRLELFEHHRCELLRVTISIAPEPVLASVSPLFVAHFYLTCVVSPDEVESA